jgi:hypothetical protein
MAEFSSGWEKGEAPPLSIPLSKIRQAGMRLAKRREGATARVSKRENCNLALGPGERWSEARCFRCI